METGIGRLVPDTSVATNIAGCCLTVSSFGDAAFPRSSNVEKLLHETCPERTAACRDGAHNFGAQPRRYITSRGGLPSLQRRIRPTGLMLAVYSRSDRGKNEFVSDDSAAQAVKPL